MYGLIYKDFLVNRKNILLFTVGMAFMHVLDFFVRSSDETGNDENGFIFIMIGALVVVSVFYILGMLELSFFEQDERKKWAYYVTASEGGVKAQIGSKYICVYLLCMGGVILCNTLNAIAMDVTKKTDSGVMGITAALFFVQMFLRAVDIPFVVAFGSKKGSNVRALGLIAAIFAAAAYLLYGDLSFFGNSMDGFWEKFFELFDAANSPKLVLGLMIAALAVMPLYYLSYRISCKYYLKGVESYDK